MKVCETTCIFMQQGRSRLFAQKDCNEINNSELRNSWSLREVITFKGEVNIPRNNKLFPSPNKKKKKFHGKQTPEMFASTVTLKTLAARLTSHCDEVKCQKALMSASDQIISRHTVDGSRASPPCNEVRRSAVLQ